MRWNIAGAMYGLEPKNTAGYPNSWRSRCDFTYFDAKPHIGLVSRL